jgi:hypothetical protein
VAWLASLPAAGAALALSAVTIGPDDPSALFPVPRALTAVSDTGVATPLATLPDGSIGYDGGLALRPGDPSGSGLYAVGNDSLGNSTLYRFGLDGSAATPVLALGQGFTGGIAYHDAEDALYLVQNDFLGASTLYRVDLGGGPLSVQLVGALGDGFVGGLTYDAGADLLYAVSADGGLFPAPNILTSIELGPMLTVSNIFALGDGSLAFDGGLAVDPDTGLFYAIANDSLANSTLTTFDLAEGGAFSAVGPSFGQGFSNAGLVLVEGVGMPIPEPSALGLFAVGCAVVGAALRRRPRGG